MKYFKKLDDWLFDARFGFQNIQNWFQINFGINCFALAKISMFYQTLLFFVNSDLFFMKILSFLTFILGFYASNSINKKIKIKTMNYLRVYKDVVFIRMHGLIIFFVPFLASFLIISNLIFLPVLFFWQFAFFYFICCTPLPPSESKFKKFLKNFSFGRRMQEV